MNFFLICSYNEQENIESVLENIIVNFKYDFKIIVVDDGSTDETLNKILEFKKRHPSKIIVLSYQPNQGLGYALKTGFLYIIKNLNFQDKDVIITIDADNTHPIELANTMVEKLAYGYDLIIASRFTLGGKQIGVPLIRRGLSFLAVKIFKTIFHYEGISDYTSGYRAYKGRIIKEFFNFYRENFIKEKNFVVQVEILFKLLKFKPKIFEVPLCLRYDKKAGKSKLKIVKNIISYIKFICKKIYESKVCFRNRYRWF